MIPVAVVLAVAAAVAAGFYAGWAAAAAAACLAAALLIPPAPVGGYGLRLPVLFVAASLLVLLVGSRLARRGRARPGPHWLDAVVLVAVILPAISTFRQSHDAVRSLAELVELVGMLGLPYLVGRLVLTDAAALRVAAAVVVIGVTLSAPLCLVESVSRPAPLERVFGLEGPNINPAPMLLYHWGPSGYRPYGFTDGFFHLVLLQVSAVALGLAWWRARRAAPRGRRFPWRWVAGVGVAVNLAALLALSRSWAGVFLPLGTLGLMGLMRWTRWRWWLALACLLVPAYVGLRATEVIPTSPLPIRNPDGSEFLAGRGRSINSRTVDERSVLDAVAAHPWLGTGAAHRLPDGSYRLRRKYAVDSRAFTTLLRSGYVGLAALLLSMAGPALVAVWRVPPASWATPDGLLVLAAAAILTALTINTLPNHGSHAIYPLIGGGLVTLTRRFGAPAEPDPEPPANREAEAWLRVFEIERENQTRAASRG